MDAARRHAAQHVELAVLGLRAHGYAVTEAPDGAAALELARRLALEGAEIIVVPRDRDLSNAQLSGLDPGFAGSAGQYLRTSA